MKYEKRVCFISIILLVVLGSTGCNLQIPQDVRIKASPSLQIPLGSRDNLLADAEGWDLDAELDQLVADTEGLSLLPVEDGEPKTLQLLANVIDISISEFAGDTLELDSFETDNQNVDTSVTVPAIDIPAIDIAALVPPSNSFSTTIADDILIDIEGNFEAATIGSGDITVTLDMPASWGINDQYSMTLTLYDSTDLGTPLATTTDNPGVVPAFPHDVVLDLSGVTIANNDLQLSYSINLESTTNSDFSLTPQTIGSTSGSIDSFSMLQVYYPDFNSIDDFSNPVDPEVVDLLTSVTFSDPKLVFSVNNQLPIDIEISVDSARMRTNDSHTFNNRVVGDTTIDPWDCVLLPPTPVDTLELPDGMGPIDFNLGVAIPAASTSDYDEATSMLTINSMVIPGTTYSMTTSVDVVLDVASMEIESLATETYTHPDGAEGMDFSQLGDVLPEGVTFSGVTSDLLLDMDPEADDHIGLRLWSDYDNDTNLDYHLGTASTFKMLKGDSVPVNGMEAVINSRPGNLFFYYIAQATNFTVTADGSDDQRISADLQVLLPLQIEAEVDADGNPPELVDDNGDPVIPRSDEDVFGRDGEDEDAQEMVEMLQSITFYATITNTFGMDVLLVLEDPDTPGFARKEFSLATGEQELSFTAEDMVAIQSGESFRPEFHIYIPTDETQSINQGSEEAPADISINLWLEIETDVDFSTGGDE